MTTSFVELLTKYRIIIPVLQRDYAQGRETGKAPEIRNSLLDAMFQAIKNPSQPLALDFIYGYIKVREDNEELFYPLDGQQRLTTLFLLHWYASARQGAVDLSKKILERFSYETRTSSTRFCSELVEFQPESFDGSIKDVILNQPWFYSHWIHDPTVHSMLTMLEAIHQKLAGSDASDMWGRLNRKPACINFHVLPMDDLGLHDDLYIKMNSRGKELTDFEYFKTRFSEGLTKQHFEVFKEKADKQWSDLFWKVFQEDNVNDLALRVDKGFLRFFRYVTDLIVYRGRLDICEDIDELERFRSVYQNSEHVDTLFATLDTFYDLYSRDQKDFWQSFYVEDHKFNSNKTRLFFINPQIDLFKKCSAIYDTSTRTNSFSIGEQLLLFACIIHLQKQSADFQRRVRILRNIISNSEDTLRREYLPELLEAVEGWILQGDLGVNQRFNQIQVNEEVQKDDLLKQHPDIRSNLHRLEDHSLLRGCLAVFDLKLDLSKYSSAFLRIFKPDCDFLKISQALFIFGDYSQEFYSNRFLGNKLEGTWRELFTPGQRRNDFNKTHEVLYKLLDHAIQNPTTTVDEMIQEYLGSYEKDPEKVKPWVYYFIKYPEFRRHKDGYYSWDDCNNEYVPTMLNAKSNGGFHWNPFLYALNERVPVDPLFKKSYGKSLDLTSNLAVIKISGHREGYHLQGDTNEEVDWIQAAKDRGFVNQDGVWPVRRSDNGYDLEDRIEVGLVMLKQLLSLKDMADQQKEADQAVSPSTDSNNPFMSRLI